MWPQLSMKNTFLPAFLYADGQTPNKNHNQSKPRKETLLRGNKRKHGLCGRNNEAETAISTAAFCCGSLIMLLYIFYAFIWFWRECCQRRLCSLIWCARPGYCVHACIQYCTCVSECMCISSMIHLWWIKPAVSIERWPRTPCTRGNRCWRRPLSTVLPNIAWPSGDHCAVLSTEVTIGQTCSQNNWTALYFFQELIRNCPQKLV